MDEYTKKLNEWKRRVYYYNYLEYLGWKLAPNVWTDVWKHHPDYDKDSSITQSFNEHFGSTTPSKG